MTTYLGHLSPVPSSCTNTFMAQGRAFYSHASQSPKFLNGLGTTNILQGNLKNIGILCLDICALLNILRGNTDSLLVGAGDGHFGLFLDSNLYHGRSQACSTYRNTPLVPGGEEFIVKTVECWTFQF